MGEMLIMNTNNTATVLKTSTGAVVTDLKEKAGVFNHFFGVVFISDNGVCPEVEDRIRGDGLGSVSFTPNLVRQVLKNN